MVRRCAFCDSPVPADATTCPVCGEKIAEERLERLLPLLKRPESPDVRYMNPIERLWGVIRRPAPTYRDIGKKPDTVGPFLIVILNALIVAGYYLVISSKLTVTVIVNGTPTQTSVLAAPQTANLFYLAALSTIIPNIFLGLAFLAIGSAFAHLAFKITGGTGKYKSSLSIVGYSMMPVILFRLFGILIVFATQPGYGVDDPATWGLAVLTIYNSPLWITLDYLTTVSFVWVGFLLIFGIREVHNTSTEWAFLVSLACMIVLTWTFWQAH